MKLKYRIVCYRREKVGLVLSIRRENVALAENIFFTEGGVFPPLTACAFGEEWRLVGGISMEIGVRYLEERLESSGYLEYS
jgi:hypothetical protein